MAKRAAANGKSPAAPSAPATRRGKGSGAAGARRVTGDFHRQTVLFQWALAKLGVSSLEEFRERFQITADSPGGIDERTGLHRFHEAIAGALPAVGAGAGTAGPNGLVRASTDLLRACEENILEHTRAINGARVRHGQPSIEWKYHQYLALLFTEFYLEAYFRDPSALRHEINLQIARHNEGAAAPDRVAPFPTTPTREDLADPRRQLALCAFWCATGSGKTLLMHMHVRQFRHHHARAFGMGGEPGANTGWPKLDQVILVTPNDGLSAQHAIEFAHSGFEVVTVDEQGVDGLFAETARRSIKILSIHKFKEEHGASTVATEAFEGCNLVLVDEGHRGAGRGEDGAWMKRRDELARDGFCFEYSATFKEAIKAGGNDEYMRNRYARSVLFDYAYRSFYRDGYGKDFTILNLEADEPHAPTQTRYLTAALLLFHQQMRVWMDGGEAMKPFQIDKPLWVFVGHTVSGGKASTTDDRVSVSDVVEVLLFLKQFLGSPAESQALIRSLLSEGFVDHHGRNLLAHRLPHLDRAEDGDVAALARRVHAEILRDVFNAHESVEGGGVLAVQMLRGAAGELALRVGEADPFGVVNVGDPLAVAEACEAHGVVRLEDDSHRPSLFHGINRDDSPLNLLVGSRKFTEGWNSWRVSSIGLMRLGRSEGTQIVQLFGRGVRLRGFRMGLRRSSVLAEKPTPPRNLRQVETLQVFGVKASYMSTFTEWILSELPEALEKQVWELPTVRTLPERRLKKLEIREEIEGVKVERGQAFRRLGLLVLLRPPDPTATADEWLRQHRTRLNWMPKIRGVVGTNRTIERAVGEVGDLPRQSLRLLPRFMFDLEALLFAIEAFKARHGLDRLHVDRGAIQALLDRDDWYDLHAAADDMRLDRLENRSTWQRMAEQLLCRYAERFYGFIRNRWEAPYLEVVDITPEDDEVNLSYTIETTGAFREGGTGDRDRDLDIGVLDGFVRGLGETLRNNPTVRWSQWMGEWRTVPFAGHLYQPLFHLGKKVAIRVSPVSLNASETRFVEDLARWSEAQRAAHLATPEICLLRNQAIGGLGFFQASNYHPDFLLWVCDGEHQHLAFVDPKGLHHLDPSDDKVQFATREIPRIRRIIERQDPLLTLHAFILTPTRFTDLGWSQEAGQRMTKEECGRLGVLFQSDDAETYIGAMIGRMGGGAAVERGA